MVYAKDVLEVVSERIRYLLYLRKMNQSELSAKAGVTQANISLILNKEKNDIKLSSLIAIAGALGVSVSYLFQENN